MPKNEIDSGEVDASKDNSKVDASGDDKSDNADKKDSQDATDDKDVKKEDGDQKKPEEKKEKIDLEELTYKERYGNSTKEMQAIKNDPVKLREFLGLDPDASLDEHFGTTKTDTDDQKDDDQDSDQDEDSDKKDDDTDTGDETLPYDKMGIKREEQVAIDFVWDNFAEKHPEIDTNPKVRESLQKNFFRFLLDEAGNRRKLKSALEDTYRFISMDQDIKKAQDKARNEGIIKATANKNGEVQSSSSKTAKSQPKNELSPQEKAMAAKMGVTEEVYLKNKIVDEDED